MRGASRFVPIVLCLALACPAAVADHCGGRVIVFTRTGVFLPGGASVGPPSVDAKLAGCAVPGVHADTNYVYPGSTMARVRYLDLIPGVAALTASLQGLGADALVTLTANPEVGAYDGPWVPIDPAARGELRATVALPGGTVTETYRTLL